ncbi:hypothetical protein HPB50_021655 [Hyalomma asiaticum]|uniref:Uncharacterized protein n=1 Tax=Hyalomma asiaticum TaxID=266040 RepID=A0ACB7T8M4_HYAAI|nr:hypothetical protein HPB50_021655 [Hyalomma asiaticum]
MHVRHAVGLIEKEEPVASYAGKCGAPFIYTGLLPPPSSLVCVKLGRASKKGKEKGPSRWLRLFLVAGIAAAASGVHSTCEACESSIACTRTGSRIKVSELNGFSRSCPTASSEAFPRLQHVVIPCARGLGRVLLLLCSTSHSAPLGHRCLGLGGEFARCITLKEAHVLSPF